MRANAVEGEGPWTLGEIERFKAAYLLHGTNWPKIKEAVGTRERTQIDIAVGGNAWAVTAPERTPVLRSSASWTFEVVEELPTARRLTVDAFTVRLCARLDGVTCAALRLVCRCERLPTRVVIDEHGWTA